MNAIKNTIVTITLLAVGYGAYVVLKSPPPHSLDDNELNWDAEADAGQVLENDAGAAEGSEANTVPANSLVEGSDLISRMSAPSAIELNPASAGANNSSAQVDENSAPDGRQSNIAHSGNPGQAPESPPPTNLASDGQNDPAVPHNAGESSEQGPDASYYDRPGADTSADRFATESTNANRFDGDSSSETFQTTWRDVQALLANTQLAEAHAKSSQLYREPSVTQSDREQLLGLLDQLAGTIIYSDQSYLWPAYQVREGESLDDIAQRHGVHLMFLARVNGLESTYRPVVGESLKVVQGPFHAEIDRQANELTLFLGSNYAGRFQVFIGDDLPTTASNYEVIEITTGREFFDRKTGYRVAKDDPNNPYGAVWIGLRGDQVTAGHNVGIHVANGTESPRGCIGVSETDARDLAIILTMGSTVKVIQ